MWKNYLYIASFLLPNVFFGQVQQEIQEAEAKRHFLQKNKPKSIWQEFKSVYTIHFHELDLLLNPGDRFISGSVRTDFTIENTTNSIAFDLLTPLMVDSVLFRGQNMPVERLPDVFRVIFPDTLPAGTMDSIRVFYSGQPPEVGGFGAFVSDDFQGRPILWTLSQPYGAPAWWPCKADLQDKIDSLDLKLNIPAEMSSASQGILVQDEQMGTRRLQKWKHRYPIAHYLISVTVSEYHLIQDTVALPSGFQLPVWHYVYPDDSLQSFVETRITEDLLLLYDSLFGVYPFVAEKYGHVRFNRSGGMEHQTMSSMESFHPDLIAHELAHQWFGNAVTCGSWQDLWLNEGFATLLTGMRYEFFEEKEEWLAYKSRERDQITQQPDGSVYAYPEDTAQTERLFDLRLRYQKAAYVLQMLRWWVGDSLFYGACRAYLQDIDLQYAFARTEDFKRIMEVNLGIDLEAFFEQWIYGEGYPSYTLVWEQKQDLLRLDLIQRPSHPSVTYFDIPLPLRVYFQSGDSLDIRMDVQSARDTAEISFPKKIQSIQIDPELHILSQGNMVYTKAQFEQLNPGVKVYPNPNNGRFTIRLQQSLYQNDVKVSLVDLSGKTVLETTLNRLEKVNNFEYSVDLQGFSSGIYLLNVHFSSGFVQQKISLLRP